ncbi:ArnT family glycosyltransferase [Calditrichota bacterium LG25]
MKRINFYQLINTKGLFLIILLAFVIRLGFFFSLQPWDNEVVKKTILVLDAYGYHFLALTLLNNKTFEAFDGFRTPGYPIFIAIIYVISSNRVWLVLLIQIFLNIFSILLIYKIVLIFFSRKIALLSALLFAIDIYQSLYSVTLLTDSLFVFLFLLSIFYLYKNIKQKNFLLIFSSALFLGIATLVRPISYLFPFIALIFIFLFGNFRLQIKFIYSLVFSITFLATISPWLIRNYSKYGEAKLSSVTGYNLLFYNVAYTEVYKSGKPIEQVRKDLYRMSSKQGIDTTNIYSLKNSQIYFNIAKQYIKDNFILYCKRHFMGIINMYAGLSTKHIASIFHLKSKSLSVDQYSGPNIFKRIIDFFNSKTKGEIFIAFFLGFYLLINYFFAFYAMLLLIRKNRKFLFVIILIILYFSALTGVVGLTRYRLPIMPFINIFCAVGLFNFYEKIKYEFLSIKIYSKHNL